MSGNTLTTIVQDSMVLAVYGRKYANLNAAQKSDIDARMADTSTKFRKELQK